MKFFNKQRMLSLSLKKLKKYVLYGIGEVLLVVIGILIAVGINNRNEERKNDQELQQIAKQLQNKLKNDLIVVEKLKLELELTKEIFDAYLYPSDSISENKRLNVINQAPYLVTVGVDFLVFDPTIHALDRVKLKNDSLSALISTIDVFYKDALKSFKVHEDFIANSLVDNINHIRESYEWYEKIALFKGKFTKEEYAYFNTTDYRNRVVHMHSIYLGSYYSQLDFFEHSLKEFSMSIKTLIED